MDTVIVALPPVDDKVYRISSEKVPHLTILFLGEANLSMDAVLYVEHAASELSPFYGTVDHRGTLGADDADVLFFEDNGWDLKRVKEFRHYLLLNDEIKRAYDAVEQFPEWTPHLTLGYPETPANEDDSDYPGIHSVQFDRVAVWLEDSDGPTFRLKYDDHAMEVSMSDLSTAERGELAVRELFHYGKKGMKWGVRHDPGHEGEQVKTKKLDKLDEKWEKSIYSTSGAVKVHNAMAEHFNTRINAINDKHPDADYRKGEDTPEWRAYMADVNTLQSQSYAAAVTSVHGSSPSGKKKAEYFNDGKGDERIVVHSAHLAHAEAEEDQPDLILLAKTDEQGRLLELNQAELAEGVEHSDAGEKFFAHFGVKGMRWGVRKDSSASRSEPKPDRGKVRRAITKGNTALEAGAKVIDKGEKKLIFLPHEARQKAASATQSRVLGEGAAINKDPRFKGKDLKRDPALKEAYFKEVEKRAVDIYKEELNNQRVEVAANMINSLLSPKRDSVTITADADSIRHEDADQDILLKLVFEVDELGQIKDVGVPESFLAHYGVKGMKWGVTKVDKASSPTLQKEKDMKYAKSSNVTVTQKKAGHYAKASGGKRLKATDDAVLAVAARQKAKKSTTDALTNDELKAAVERMRLEQEYAKLDAKTKRIGKGFVARLFSNPDARERNADLLKRAAQASAAA